MYKTVLVRSLVQEGENLVAALERRRLSVAAAFWYYEADRMTWRLFIATRSVDRDGPAQVYRRIQSALSEMRDTSLSLDDISVVSPSGPQFDEIRRQIQGIARVGPFVPSAPPKDVVFEDVYVYRWHLNGGRIR